MSFLIVIVAGYAVGSLPIGLLVCRALGFPDVRELGSGSAGATNVLRAHGWRAALAVALVDIGKGWLAATGLPPLAGSGAWPEGEIWLPAVAGLAAVVGHVWPLFSGFRGGKGVATTGGVLLAASPAAFLVCVALFTGVAAASRRVSVASLAAVGFMPGVVWILGALGGPRAVPLIAFGLAAIPLVTWTHRTNIANLTSGREPRIGRMHPPGGSARGPAQGDGGA